MVVVAIIYFCFGTAFTFGYQFKPHDGYYGFLTDAFAHGQLHLGIAPDPHLLKMNYPYDPNQTKPYRLHDATLHDGKYYLYWGPVPVLLRFITLDLFEEGFYTYLYVLGCACFSLLILRQIKKIYFKELSDWYVLLTFIYLAFNGAVLHLIACIGIYYESIAAAQFFFLGGFYFYLKSMASQERRRHTYYLWAASLFMALSTGSRITFIFPAILVIGYELYRIKAYLFLETWDTKVALKSLAILTPFTCLLLILAWYNAQRFGNPLEFGLKEQLTGLYEPHFDKNISIQNIPNNLKNYFFSIPTPVPFTPYLLVNKLRYTVYERIIASVFLLSPVTLFILFSIQLKQTVRKIYWFIGTLAGLLTFLVIYLMPYTVTRYIFDMIFFLNILGAIKVFSVPSKWTKGLLIGYLPIMIFISIGFWFYAVGEYHPWQYFHYNQAVYQMTGHNRTYVEPAYSDSLLINGPPQK